MNQREIYDMKERISLSENNCGKIRDDIDEIKADIKGFIKILQESYYTKTEVDSKLVNFQNVEKWVFAGISAFIVIVINVISKNIFK
jgi:hypothetical protein